MGLEERTQSAGPRPERPHARADWKQMVGIGIIINGLLFTLPRKTLPGNSGDALAQQALDAVGSRGKYEPPPVPGVLTNQLGPGTNPQLVSITEHTTHHLKTGK